MSVNAELRHTKRRRSLLDPSSGLFRTHWFADADSFSQANFSDRTRPITFAAELILDTVAPNGIVFEVGKATHGSAIWLDSALGTLGFCAGQGTAVPNDGIAGTTPLNHMGISTVDLVVAGGTGYSVNDLITLAGGTFLRAAVLRVLTLSGSAVATVSIEDAGVYSVAPADPVVQDSVSPPGGSGATFNLTFGLTRTTRLHVVAAVIPCAGDIRMWVDGHLKVAAQAVSGNFNAGAPATSIWADGPGAGGIGAVDGTVIDRVPAGARVSIANATIVADKVSFYDAQRPQHFYNAGALS